MYWYRIAIWEQQAFKGNKVYYKKVYRPEYQRGNNGYWHIYYNGGRDSWEKAYAVLEQHANPARLAVRFVGTF